LILRHRGGVTAGTAAGRGVTYICPMSHPSILEELRRQITVLVVDDEPIVRRIAYRLLSEDGCRVLEAADAEEARTLIEMASRPVDAALIDVVMPGDDGATLVRELLERWPRLPVVLMSAHPAQIMADHDLDRFRIPFLAKPFSRDELFVRLREALGRRPARTPGEDGDPQAGPCQETQGGSER
jgi:DNA-binding NtrC family response regulator